MIVLDLKITYIIIDLFNIMQVNLCILLTYLMWQWGFLGGHRKPSVVHENRGYGEKDLNST